MPSIKKKNGFQQKPECEFCGSKHSASDEFCDLKIDEVDCNTFEGAGKFTI
jgi:hypothetical protein